MKCPKCNREVSLRVMLGKEKCPDCTVDEMRDRAAHYLKEKPADVVAGPSLIPAASKGYQTPLTDDDRHWLKLIRVAFDEPVAK